MHIKEIMLSVLIFTMATPSFAYDTACQWMFSAAGQRCERSVNCDFWSCEKVETCPDSACQQSSVNAPKMNSMKAAPGSKLPNKVDSKK